MNTLRRDIFSKYYLFALSLFLLSGCTKEDAKLPYSQITSFTITDTAGKVLQAAIADQDIIVYWPFGQTLPADITPQISISDKAAVKPASGEKVAFNSSTSYTVTAQNGTVVTYKIKIVSNQPAPVIGLPEASSFIYPGGVTSFIQLYLLRDTSRTHFSLISATGQKHPCIIDSITRDKAFYKYPAVLDTGRYKLLIESGVYSSIAKPVYYYRPGSPELYDFGTLVLKRGQTFTLKGNYLSLITRAWLTLDLSTEKNIEVISNTTTTVTLRIPADFPVGSYEYGLGITDRYYDKEDNAGWEAPVAIVE